MERGDFFWAVFGGDPLYGEWARAMVQASRNSPYNTEFSVWLFLFSLAINNAEFSFSSLKLLAAGWWSVGFLGQLCKFYLCKHQTHFKEAQAWSPWPLFSLLQTKLCFFCTSGRAHSLRVLPALCVWLCDLQLWPSLLWSSLLWATLPICGLGFQMFPSFIKDAQSLHLCFSFLL